MEQAIAKAQVLIEAMEYIQRFNDRIVVVATRRPPEAAPSDAPTEG